MPTMAAESRNRFRIMRLRYQANRFRGFLAMRILHCCLQRVQPPSALPGENTTKAASGALEGYQSHHHLILPQIEVVYHTKEVTKPLPPSSVSYQSHHHLILPRMEVVYHTKVLTKPLPPCSVSELPQANVSQQLQ
ncbi:uncharacterized protein LOC124146781 [Haliotis rufescens]|uniref:uncharacterized protein LOC124146781 n=1 Tax=Haliotis rufescens TaxID=6454 RepID=UPI00201F370A|nr:uncharacterized protein LOC124146781 [Haliotis rufescens]